ncbi:phosphatidyl serine synthase-domain-containing protein [Obelidium mucronatum]|nr:phosphatidyl serine synthase-domain-containing protein [Obelidium mucronatum]
MSRARSSTRGRATGGRSRSASDIARCARDDWQYTYADEIKPSLEFLYRPHTITALVFLLAGLVYYALFLTGTDVVSNTKMGIAGCFGVIILTGLLEFKDGPFIRPHPAFWRVVLAVSVFYQLVLVILLFQDKSTARHLMTYLDPSLGVELPEKNYAGDCSLTWETIWDQMDVFVLAHTFGWYAKSMVLRDPYICWILSIMFEFLEYSLEHQLPNFAECWWDHWILDVLITNWLGIYLGMKTCEYFAMKTYSWRSVNQIPSYQGKLQRGIEQFTPHSWTSFDWGPSKSFRNYIAVLALMAFELQIELNAFYLKALLWIPPPHFINITRLIVMFFFCMPATREVYQYLSDPRCKRLGYHAWMLVANVFTETFICIKFGRGEFTEPFPAKVITFWSVLAAFLIGYAVIQFVMRKRWGWFGGMGEEEEVVKKAIRTPSAARRKKKAV